ncbi:MAG: nuclease-related domain-containing protein [Desulfuromonadaceae bacterium]|nr:nuclease-related domain-containing protein [Desulfuromonadaceae bacterium]
MNKSENRMLTYLKDNLPSDWVVLGNVPLVEPKRDYEVDAIIIGGGTIWVVEGKCWRGSITGDQFIWVQNGGKGRTSPLRSLGEKSRILSSTVKNCGIKSFVTHLVIMLADKGTYSLSIDNDPSVKACVHHLHDVHSQLITASKVSSLTTAQLSTLVKRLGGTGAETQYNKYLAIGNNSDKSEQNEYNKNKSVDVEETESIFIFTLHGEENFTRTYYSCDFKKILLGRSEIRGAFPQHWKNWINEGMFVRFSKSCVGFEAAEGTKVILNRNNELPIGKIVKPSSNTGQLNIGGIEFSFEIETIIFD